MADPYQDSVLGDWKFESKSLKKKQFVWKRKATITLHKDHAQKWTNPETFKAQKVYGEVVLIETKQIDKKSSSEQRFRGLELTPKSTVEDYIP